MLTAEIDEFTTYSFPTLAEHTPSTCKVYCYVMPSCGEKLPLGRTTQLSLFGFELLVKSEKSSVRLRSTRRPRSSFCDRGRSDSIIATGPQGQLHSGRAMF